MGSELARPTIHKRARRRGGTRPPTLAEFDEFSSGSKSSHFRFTLESAASNFTTQNTPRNFRFGKSAEQGTRPCGIARHLKSSVGKCGKKFVFNTHGNEGLHARHSHVGTNSRVSSAICPFRYPIFMSHSPILNVFGRSPTRFSFFLRKIKLWKFVTR